MKRASGTFACFLLLLAACGGGGNGDGTASPRATDEKDAAAHRAMAKCSATQGTLHLVAKNSRFDTDCLAAQAGRPFLIEMDNQDDLQHNVAIHKSEDASHPIFTGKIVGKQKITYEVPAIAAGTYHFHCQVHPDMQGAFIAQT